MSLSLNKRTVHVEQWAEQVRAGDIRAVSRAISAIEDQARDAEDLMRLVFPATGKAHVTGVTGAPGTGKSTIVDCLATHYRARSDNVGVIAVDPTSPFTGGAILGDRIRMQRHASDNGIFIRSMATRGFLGGLARTTADVALLLDAAGKKEILIETVGVGQDEVEVVRLADCVAVVLVPGFGDDIQNMKAGLMEIADIFVLNKADREGVERLEEQLQAMLSVAPQRDGWRPSIVRTVASEGKGIEELAGQIGNFRRQSISSPQRKLLQTEHWRRRLVEMIERTVVERTLGGPDGYQLLDRLASEVAERKKDPFTAVAEILSKSHLG